jgi:hypothetical protein
MIEELRELAFRNDCGFDESTQIIWNERLTQPA